jgi:hypothetical protein
MVTAAATRMVECKDCVHFRELPGGTPWKRKTGCYHPDLMEQKQGDGFLKEQEIPGDHTKLNLLHDCAKFEPRPRRPSLVDRMKRWMRE